MKKYKVELHVNHVIMPNTFQGTGLDTSGRLDKNSEGENTSLKGQNMIEQGQSAINKAKDAQTLLEQNDKNLFDQQ